MQAQDLGFGFRVKRLGNIGFRDQGLEFKARGYHLEPFRGYHLEPFRAKHSALSGLF